MDENKKLKTEIFKVEECTVEYFIFGKKCYLTATEWSNGEGWTINIISEGIEKTFQLNFTDYSALKLAIESLHLNS